MIKQTPVEWLVEQSIQLFQQYMNGTLNEDTIEGDVYNIVTKAKEMEQEQYEKLKEFEYWKEWKNNKPNED